MTLEAEFSEHSPFLRALARRLTADPSTADDLVQETYVAALTGGQQRPQSFAAWLTAVLRIRAARRIRTDTRRRNREQTTARDPSTLETADVAIKIDVARRLLQHVEALDAPYRDAIFLRYYENLMPQQMAGRLGVPLGTVKTRLARALAQLRELLDADHPEGRQNWFPALCAISGIDSGTTGTMASNAAVVMRAPKLVSLLIVAGIVLTATFAVSSLLPNVEEPRLQQTTTGSNGTTPEQTPVGPETRRELVAAASQIALVRGLVEDTGIGTEPGHGQPVANVVVRCRLKQPGSTTSEVEVTTDSQGNFQIELPAHAVLIAAKAPGNEMQRAAYWNAPEGPDAPPGPPESLLLSRYPNGQLVGIVTEPSGTAVADAQITLSGWEEGERKTQTTSSAQDGSFGFKPRETDSALAAERDGFLQVSASTPTQRPRGGWEPARILLARAGILTVEVVDALGQPIREIPNVAVLLSGAEQGLLTATNCGGGNYFRGLAPVVQGRATLPVPAELQLQLYAGNTQFDRELGGQCQARSSGSQAGQPIVVGAGKELMLRMVIRNLKVLVLNQDGQVAADTQLRLEAPRNGHLEPLRIATTDANGRFEFPMGTASGVRALLATATGTGANSGLRAQRWLRLDDAAPKSLELRLAPAQQLVGHVHDASGRAIVAQVRRALTLPGENESIGYGELSTDENGAFSLPSVAGAVQRLEVLSNEFATVACDDVLPDTPIEVVLKQPKRARLRLVTNATTTAIADLVVRVDYLEAKNELAPAWPTLGATTHWSHAALQVPLPLHDLSQRIQCPEGTWRTEEYRHVPPIDGPTGRVYELQLDSGPASISVSGSGANNETLSLVATGPVTIPADQVELPLALSRTTTCRGSIVFAEGSTRFAACVGIADDSGRLLMLSKSHGAAWETMQEASSHGFFALSEVPVGVWELQVGTRADLERGEARRRQRVVIAGDGDEPIVVKL
jgi:RNA polymerase sigma factor (sigma-70 family)